MYTCIYIYVYMYIFIYVHVYVCVYVYMYICISLFLYIYIYICVYSPNKDFSQGRGSYFCCLVIPLCFRIAGGQPRCLSLGA